MGNKEALGCLWLGSCNLVNVAELMLTVKTEEIADVLELYFELTTFLKEYIW